MSTQLVVKEFEGSKIRFESRKDGRVWGCLTDMAKANDKRVNDYLRLSSTDDYLNALSADAGIPVANIICVIPGQKDGTWAVDEVFIDFAQWVSMPFRIWSNRALRDVILSSHATAEQLQKRVEVLQSDLRKSEDRIYQLVKEKNARLRYMNNMFDAFSE